MNKEENDKIKSIIRQRFRALEAGNCKYCGGIHDLHLSLDGLTIMHDKNCCPDLIRDANEILIHTRKEFGDKEFLKKYCIEYNDREAEEDKENTR